MRRPRNEGSNCRLRSATSGFRGGRAADLCPGWSAGPMGGDRRRERAGLLASGVGGARFAVRIRCLGGTGGGRSAGRRTLAGAGGGSEGLRSSPDRLRSPAAGKSGRGLPAEGEARRRKGCHPNHGRQLTPRPGPPVRTPGVLLRRGLPSFGGAAGMGGSEPCSCGFGLAVAVGQRNACCYCSEGGKQLAGV